MALSDEAARHARSKNRTTTVSQDEAAASVRLDGDTQDVGTAPTVTPYRTVTSRATETADPNWDGDDDGVVHNESSWEALPSIDYTGSGIPETPPGASLAQAWAAVMAEVQEIRKGEQFNGGGVRYSYRGVDAVINAVGPALRKHHVMILPIRMQPSYRDVTVGSKGTSMRECTMTVTYQIRGASGTVWEVVGQGESLDSGDKGTTKAGTVAFRNMLLTALAVPVDNPRLDPDAQEYKRGRGAPTGLPSATQLRDESLRSDVSLNRLKAIFTDIDYRKETAQFPELGQTLIQNENGDDEKLAPFIRRRIVELEGKS